MVAVAELAVRLGNLKIPKGVLVPLREVHSIADKDIVIICTGGQGEPGAALSRMAAGEHRTLTLKKGDSVVISSTPIPGNEQRYAAIGDYLARMDVTQYRHPTHEIDGTGPLHVSGHAFRDEHKEMIRLTRPKFLMPIYGGALPRKYHKDIGIAEGLSVKSIIMVDNGMYVELDSQKITSSGTVTSGSLLVDQTGAVVPEIVTKDRLLLMDDGFIVVVLTVNSRVQLLASPDILSRGHIAVKDHVEIMQGMRVVIKKVMTQRTRLTSRTSIDILKNDLRSSVADYVYGQLAVSPIVIPVVNVIDAHGRTNQLSRPVVDAH